MANKTISIMKLKQIVRLKSEGCSNRKIALMLSIHRETVGNYVTQIKSCKASYSELLSMPDNELESLFEKPPNQKADIVRVTALREFFPYMDKELKRVGVDRWNMWREYMQGHADGYAYSHFCREYHRWFKKQDVVMHFEHKAADKLYVDFTGKKLEIVDRDSGEITKVDVLVAVLGCSQYTYVEATKNQQKENFIAAVENALHYFGGVPQAIVPDNLKPAVTKGNKYEPKLNEAFEDFGLHYGTTILPTRPYEPRDKALVEGAVNITYKRIFAPLRNLTFFHITELNIAIKEQLEGYNTIHFRGKDHSRKELFVQLEKGQLAPLPVDRYEIKKFKLVTVLQLSHVLLLEDKHYYSVHYKHMGEKVKLIYTKSYVEIYSKGERIALHQRNYRKYSYTTVKHHMPSAHQFVADWSPEKFLSWATDIGPPTKAVIEKILESKAHPEQGYRSCVGILSFVRKVGKERLNKACSRAMYYQNYNYGSIKNILDRGLDKEILPEEEQYKLPFHDNIRGKEYYQ